MGEGYYSYTISDRPWSSKFHTAMLFAMFVLIVWNTACRKASILKGITPYIDIGVGFGRSSGPQEPTVANVLRPSDASSTGSQQGTSTTTGTGGAVGGGGSSSGSSDRIGGHNRDIDSSSNIPRGSDLYSINDASDSVMKSTITSRRILQYTDTIRISQRLRASLNHESYQSISIAPKINAEHRLLLSETKASESPSSSLLRAADGGKGGPTAKTAATTAFSANKPQKVLSNMRIDEQQLPPTSRSMSDLNLFLYLLNNSIPFGYAQFNDGEVLALDCKEGQPLDFGWQNCSKSLSNAMRQSMVNIARNFYVGVPCVCEFGNEAFVNAAVTLNITHNLSNSGKPNCPITPLKLSFPFKLLEDRLTVATVFINGNFRRAKSELSSILKHATDSQGRKVHVIVGEGHNVTALPFRVASVQYIAKKGAFEANYTALRTAEFIDKAGYAADDIVLLMAGPLGRILASEWTRLRPLTTFIDMGSFWDVELWRRGRSPDRTRACMYANDTNAVDTRWW
jgi:hypothetical protein